MRHQQGRGLIGSLAAAALIALVAAAAWWYVAPDTLPPALRHAAPPSPTLTDKPPALYKWRDDKGQLHVTDVPPDGGRKYETVRYNPATNVVPAYHRPGETPAEAAEE